MTMNETPLFFQRESQRLFGVLHQPVAAPAQTGYVFCHPFAEEKLWAHRVFVSFARELAARGYAVLRFDFRGHGDSDGYFEEATIESYQTDIEAAAVALRERAPSVRHLGLLGLRLGATLAALVAERSATGVDRLVLWDPIIDGEKYGQEILMTNLATQMATHGKVVTDRAKLAAQMEAGATVNIDGYEMSGAIFRQIGSLSLSTSTPQFGGNCFIAQIDRGPKPLRADLSALKQRYGSAELAQVVEQPFWKEIKEFYNRADNLFAPTLDWISRQA